MRHNYFELAIQMVIICNVAVMTVYYCEPRPALQWSAGVGQGACVLPDWSQNLQTYANYVFTAIYLVEMVSQARRLRPRLLLLRVELFDFALVLSSLVDVYSTWRTRSTCSTPTASRSRPSLCACSRPSAWGGCCVWCVTSRGYAH